MLLKKRKEKNLMSFTLLLALFIMVTYTLKLMSALKLDSSFFVKFINLFLVLEIHSIIVH